MLRLEPDYDSLDSLVATSDEEGISKTISFIGPTHEGKSFLIRMLMGGYVSLDMPAIIFKLPSLSTGTA